ncbi:hypothetical protein [Neisseria meningitidis]|uniref:hypothetical protein n=1 Tax=Neisseria meningitidis TaxID=487 RepID=UPI0013B360A4|nr:hypothetical protein [Neisseria meningitidis]
MPSESMRRQTDSRQNNKIKKQCAGEIGLFCASRIFRRHFLVNKTGYFLSIAFRRLAPPPKKGRIRTGLGRGIHLILRMDDVLFSSK